MSKTVSIVTFQSAAIVDALTCGDLLTAQRRFVPHGWERAYSWMRVQMRKRCGNPPIQNGLLMWGWPLGSEPPDVDTKGSENEPLNRIGLTLPQEDVLISDFHAWHVVLSDAYLSKDEADSDRYDAQAQSSGRTQLGEKETSWQRVFHPEHLADTYWGERAQRIYQACFWQPAASAIASVRQTPS